VTDSRFTLRSPRKVLLSKTFGTFEGYQNLLQRRMASEYLSSGANSRKIEFYHHAHFVLFIIPITLLADVAFLREQEYMSLLIVICLVRRQCDIDLSAGCIRVFDVIFLTSVIKFGNLLEVVRISNYPETYNLSTPSGEHESRLCLFFFFTLCWGPPIISLQSANRNK